MIKILYNAHIYTLDPLNPLVSALAIDQNRIIQVGNSQDLLREYPNINEKFDAGGKTIIPGLIDAHIHLEQYSLLLQKVDCETPSFHECLERVAEQAQQTPPGKWLLGHGWNQNDWKDIPEAGNKPAHQRVKGWMMAHDLDDIAPHHPVYLTAKSLHAAWVNSLALQLAGIHPESLEPPGGHIQRDNNGTPTGILFENAMSLVKKAIPDPSLDEVITHIRTAQSRLWHFGLTGVHDFDRQRCFHALQYLHNCEELKVRIIKQFPVEALTSLIDCGLRSGFGDDILRVGSIKLFSDGALGPRTAAMLQAYEGEPHNFGLLLSNAQNLLQIGRLAISNGLSLSVHAIGDRANQETLNAFAQLRSFEDKLSKESSTFRPLRHRIEHVQLLHPSDTLRLAQSGLVASMQPLHATSDMAMADCYWGKRAEYAYPWRTLLKHNTHLAFGSDAPVENPNPFWGIHAAVTRQRFDGSPGIDGWYPAQRITVKDAISAYTKGAAFAAGQENQLGTLAPGYLADLVILNANPFECEPMELKEIRPLATMMNGEWVWIS